MPRAFETDAIGATLTPAAATNRLQKAWRRRTALLIQAERATRSREKADRYDAMIMLMRSAGAVAASSVTVKRGLGRGLAMHAVIKGREGAASEGEPGHQAAVAGSTEVLSVLRRLFPEFSAASQKARQALGKPGTAYTSIWEEPDETDEECDDARSETSSLLSYGSSSSAD